MKRNAEGVPDFLLTLPLLMESRSRSLGIVDHHPPEYAIRSQFFRGELQWSSEFWQTHLQMGQINLLLMTSIEYVHSCA